jgi:hypothetical protein
MVILLCTVQGIEMEQLYSQKGQSPRRLLINAKGRYMSSNRTLLKQKPSSGTYSKEGPYKRWSTLMILI